MTSTFRIHDRAPLGRCARLAPSDSPRSEDRYRCRAARSRAAIHRFGGSKRGAGLDLISFSQRIEGVPIGSVRACGDRTLMTLLEFRSVRRHRAVARTCSRICAGVLWSGAVRPEGGGKCSSVQPTSILICRDERASHACPITESCVWCRLDLDSQRRITAANRARPSKAGR